MTANTHQKTGKNDIWHHRGPVVISPVFDWPPKPAAAFLALTKRWFTITRNLLFLTIALCVYNFFLPEFAELKTLSLDWIAPVFARNAALILVIAGGLHWYLFIHKGQGKKLKYDSREEMEKSKKFSFNDQLKDNIFWSMTSGVAVWSVYEVLYYWGVANGVIPVLKFPDHAGWILLWFLVLPMFLSTHFYFIHRFLHWPPIYFRFHRQHHNNIHIGPWSGMSMHPVEHILYISSVVFHYVIPSHPVIVLVHLYTRCLAPAFSHAGFEKLLVKNRIVTDAADFHHQLHHKYFECNYGNVDAPWDRVLNTLHDGSEEATVVINERRRRMYAKRRA